MASPLNPPSCQVCKLPYTIDEPGPYLIPCLHAVCHACVTSDISKVVICDTCNETFKKDLDLPKDEVTSWAIFQFHVQHKSPQVLCTNMKDGNEAASWCHVCKALLCKQCTDTHQDVKSTSLHNVTPLQDLTFAGTMSLASVKYCSKHTSHPEDLFDLDCHIEICPSCVLVAHRNCNILERSAYMEEYKHGSLSANVNALKDKTATVAAAIKDDSQELRLRKNAMLLKEQVKDTFAEFRSQLDNREQELSNDLNEYLETGLMVDVKGKEETSLQQVRCESALDYSKRCLESGIDVLGMKEMIEVRTTNLLKAESPKDRTKGYSIAFSSLGRQELSADIRTFGTIYAETTEQEEEKCVPSSDDKYRSDATASADTSINFEKSHEHALCLLESKLAAVLASCEDRILFLERQKDSNIYTLKLPELKFDKESLNTDAASLTKDMELINKHSSPSGRKSWRRLKYYRGTTSTKALSSAGLQFWEVHADVELNGRLKGERLILETGMCPENVLDTHYRVSGLQSSWALRLSLCSVHSSVCLSFWEEKKRVECCSIEKKSTKSSFAVTLGLLFDPEGRALSFLDLTSEKIFHTMKGVDVNQELWPVFGVYNTDKVRVAMNLVAGKMIDFNNIKEKMVEMAVADSV